MTEIAGDAGARLHTGRSRTQVALIDLRLWVKREMKEISGLVLDLQETLLTHAKQSKDSYLPGYTHMQQAQPVYFHTI